MNGRPAVSVVVPSIGSRGTVFGATRCFVTDAVRSVLATADVPVEVIVVAGREMPPDVSADLVALPEAVLVASCGGDRGGSNRQPAGERRAGAEAVVRIVDYDAAFNFSAAVNLGAAHAAGEQLLLLNDDVDVVTSDWLTRMRHALAEPGVGAVGARLLFEDGTLQHAGHTYRGALGHVGFGLPGDAPGHKGILSRRRPVAGVTAACMLVPMRVYDAVGGLWTGLPGNYNDVDLCMKIRTGGWTILYEPAAVLYHFESRSRVAGIRLEEIEHIGSRWGSQLIDDPFTPPYV